MGRGSAILAAFAPLIFFAMAIGAALVALFVESYLKNRGKEPLRLALKLETKGRSS